MPRAPDNKAHSFLEEYRRACRQTGCRLDIENGTLTIIEANAPQIDEAVKVLRKAHEPKRPTPAKPAPAPVATAPTPAVLTEPSKHSTPTRRRRPSTPTTDGEST